MNHLPLYLFGCGASQFGQLGGIFPTNIPKPARVSWVTEQIQRGGVFGGGPNAGLKSVAAGGMHTLFVDENGTVWSCGSNDDAALGYKTPPGFEGDIVETPQPVESLRRDGFRVVKVVAGSTVSAALSDQGELRIWGTFKASEGPLGFSRGTDHQFSPITLRLPTRRTRTTTNHNNAESFTSISAGSNHIVTVTTHGNVYTWGVGELGELGRKVPSRLKIHGTVPGRVVFGRRSQAVTIGTGAHHSFIVDSEGDVWGFGLNNNGQLGIGHKNSPSEPCVFTPTRIEALSEQRLGGATVVEISGGEAHTLFRVSDGRVFGCGLGDVGQLGISDLPHPEYQEYGMVVPVPVEIPLPDSHVNDPVVRISASSRGSWVVTADGALYAWGEGNSSELGYGLSKREASSEEERISIIERTPKVIVRREGGWKAEEVACGGQHSVCLVRRR
ncbi:RCC1/BLIP-II [Marasmius fiardii PR-910]|nr:RCC1/BLIP-II [Marasmius fiardii PR-910]